jgi:hypothetical protein
LDLVAAAAANSGIVLDGSGDMPSTPSKGSNHVDTAAALAAAAQVAADQLTTLPPEVQELAGALYPQRRGSISTMRLPQL